MDRDASSGTPRSGERPAVPSHLRNHPVDAGIWYWLWMGPKRGWELWAYRADLWGDPGHTELWRAEVAPAFGRAHRLSAAQVRTLQDLPYAMPRGRLSRALEDLSSPAVSRGTWLLLHGGDTPIDAGAAEGQVLSEFGLNVMAARDLTRWLADEHERMLPEDRDALRTLLGKSVPY